MPNKKLFQNRPYLYQNTDTWRQSWPEPDEVFQLFKIEQRKRKEMAQDKLTALMRAVSEHYKDDATNPGVLVSYLPRHHSYYVAVHRYFNSGGTTKEIICSGTSTCLDTAISDVARQFLDLIGKKETEVEKLRRAVK